MDHTQSFEHIFLSIEFNGIHVQETDVIACHANDAIAHDHGSRINT